MKRFSIISLLFLISLATFAQNERKVIREGVKAYQEGDYSDAEVQFRKAQDINNESFAAEFNTGAALYGQEKYEETVKQFEPLTEKSSNPETLSKIWHNVGNSLLEAQQYEPSIEAFKNSLRLNPTDTDTKYNLAYAKMKLQEQQQQQQNQDQQNKDQQNEDQQDKEQQNEDQQDQDQQNDDQQDQEQQNEDQQDQEQQNEDQQDQEQQGKPQAISKEDAERMLNAIQQQEKDVKGKVDKKKAAVAKVKTEKDW